MTTIQDAIDTILVAVPGAPLPDSVDTFKAGDPSQHLTGIATTFLATYEVIEEAIELGANLIITHEPTFYNHLDETEWLRGDEVYEAKRRLIDESSTVIWRFHDYIHMLQPDGIMTGVLRELEWEAYALPEDPFLCHIPPMSLREMTAWLKEKLGTETVRLVGDVNMICRRVGLAIGAAGGEMQIKAFGQEDIDVLVCGEIHEWETSEYARDAVRLGQTKALIVVGHAPSEEAGMKWLVDWLKPRLPGITITFVQTGKLFHWL